MAAPYLAGALAVSAVDWVAVATPRDQPPADQLGLEDLARLLDLEVLELVAEASAAVLADVEVAVADLAEETDLAAAVEAEEVLAVVAEEEDSAADEVELAISRTATDLQMARPPVLAPHVMEALEADALATEIVIAIEEVTGPQAVGSETTDEEEEVVAAMTEAPAAQTTNPSAAGIDREKVAGMVGMVGTTARESVGTKVTATTIHDSEGGIRAHSLARVCFCKGLSRLSPFFRLNISRP